MSPLTNPAPGFSQTQADARFTRKVASIADLKALSGSDLAGEMQLSAYFSGGNDGGGKFFWDATQTAVAYTTTSANDLINATNGFQVGEKIKFYGSAPGGLTVGTTYYVTFIPAWKGAMAYVLGAQVTYGGRFYEATTAGTSSATVPGTLGTTTTGQTVTDGTAVWTDRGAAPAANSYFQVASTYRDAIANPSRRIDITSDTTGYVNRADDGGTMIEANSNPQDGRWRRHDTFTERWRAEWFGTISTSAAANRTANLTNAFEARGIRGGIVTQGSGTFTIAGNVFRPPNVVYKGEGKRATWVAHTGDNACFWVDGNSNMIQGAGKQVQPGGISGMTIQAQSTISANQKGISLSDVSGSYFEDLEVTNYQAGTAIELVEAVPYLNSIGSEGNVFVNCITANSKIHWAFRRTRTDGSGSFSDTRIIASKITQQVNIAGATGIRQDNGTHYYAGTLELKIQIAAGVSGFTCIYQDGDGLTWPPNDHGAHFSDNHYNIAIEDAGTSTVFIRQANTDVFTGSGQAVITTAISPTSTFGTNSVYSVGHKTAPSWDRGNADVVLPASSSKHTHVYFNTALTADRTLTLPTTGQLAGEEIMVERGTGATGAYGLNVYSGATIQTLRVPGAKASFVWTGSAWREKWPVTLGTLLVNEARNLQLSPSGRVSWGVGATDKFNWTVAMYLLSLPPQWFTGGFMYMLPVTSGVLNSLGGDVANANGITLTGWESLWVVVTKGVAGGANIPAANMRVFNHTSSLNSTWWADENAIKIAQRNFDTGNLHLRTGKVLVPGEVWRVAPGTPTAAAGAAAGTSPPTPTLTGANKDENGTISITTGTGTPTAGTYATITFASPYGVAPIVTISPLDAVSAARQVYATATTTAITIGFGSAGAASTAYQFAYRAKVG